VRFKGIDIQGDNLEKIESFLQSITLGKALSPQDSHPERAPAKSRTRTPARGKAGVRKK
jgi:hypothetical protein